MMKILITGGNGSGYSGDNSLLLKELQDFEFISINNSIKALYDWFEQNKSKLEGDIR